MRTPWTLVDRLGVLRIVPSSLRIWVVDKHILDVKGGAEVGD